MWEQLQIDSRVWPPRLEIFAQSLYIPHMRFRIGALIVVLLLLQVPWLAAGEQEIGGVPVWAAYALAGAIVFSSIVSFCVARFWERFADDPDAEAGD